MGFLSWPRAWLGLLSLCAACHRGELVGEGAPPRAAHEERGPRQPGETSAKAAVAISDDPVINALVELAGERSEVGEILATVVAVGPRLTGSTQSIEAEKWALAQLREWGLVAAREQWGELPVLFERGKATGDVIRPVRATLEVGTPAWTPGTRGQDGVGAGGPMRGQALLHPRTATEFREVEPYLRDAWIMLPHDFEYPDWRLMRQLERAFELAPISGYVHASGGPHEDRIWMSGDPRLDPAQLPSRVDVHLRGDEHQVLLERMAAGDYVELEFAVGNMLLPGPVPAHNVVAALPGAERPQEQVIVGGHLDSWDGALGAIDNATGVATTLEAARLLAAACARTGARPRRTIRFQLWTGEEQGQLGSSAWVEAHADELSGISAVLIHDGSANYVSSLAVVPELHALMLELVEPVGALAPARRPFELELVESLPRRDSDSRPFLDAGVPAFDWGHSGRVDDERYLHTQYDRPEAVIDEYQRHSALVVAIVAWQLANMPGLLPRENVLPLAARSLGVVLAGTRVEALGEATALGAQAGLLVGDRILAVDGGAVGDGRQLELALRRGDSRKRLSVARGQPQTKLEVEVEVEVEIEIEIDFRVDPVEAARETRRNQRRERFAPELIPWDNQADGGSEHSGDN